MSLLSYAKYCWILCSCRNVGYLNVCHMVPLFCLYKWIKTALFQETSHFESPLNITVMKDFDVFHVMQMFLHFYHKKIYFREFNLNDSQTEKNSCSIIQLDFSQLMDEYVLYVCWNLWMNELRSISAVTWLSSGRGC